MGYTQTSVLFSWSFTNMLVLWPSMYLREIQNNSAPALLISYPEMAINSRNDTKFLYIGESGDTKLLKIEFIVSA